MSFLLSQNIAYLSLVLSCSTSLQSIQDRKHALSTTMVEWHQ